MEKCLVNDARREPRQPEGIQRYRHLSLVIAYLPGTLAKRSRKYDGVARKPAYLAMVHNTGSHADIHGKNIPRPRCLVHPVPKLPPPPNYVRMAAAKGFH